MSQSLTSIRKKQAKGMRMSIGTKVLAGLVFLVAYFVTGEFLFLVATLIVIAAGVAMALFMKSVRAKLEAQDGAAKAAPGTKSDAPKSGDDSPAA